MVKTDSEVFLTNGRTDFRPDFADFRNFSGPYDEHTYSPPQKKTQKQTDRPGGIKKNHGRTRTAFRNSAAISSCNSMLNSASVASVN